MLEALRAVPGPNRTSDIVSLKLVSEIVVAGKDVMFAINVDPAQAGQLEPLRKAAERAVASIPGIGKVMVALTAEKKGNGAEAGPQPPAGAAPGAGGRRQSGGVPGVKHIVAVASGKGGVGKSTTAVNLALGLQTLGLKVGVLDADVYGPSMPRLLGLTGRPEPVEPGSRTLKPLQGFGLKVMSIGFLVEEDTPMIWRGPMVMSALQQMLREVDWGELDIMVVDMPPGTGDAQLTLAQQTPLAGAVIVSTPQDLALIDARKGLNMFRRVDVPVLGIIENMSYFVCHKCGERHEIFGHGGAHMEADRLGIAFLGEIPLDPEMRWRSDAGQPIVVSNPDSVHAAIFRDIAAKVWGAIAGEAAAARPAPRIVVE
ncbi:MAG TPA: Mrp/NBP35 family ATP-binding protein [Thermohalobaculum sp.]|nr:Mrp/NBP35 family ATP-binding protein [Thermohalobaculum sp.]